MCSRAAWCVPSRLTASAPSFMTSPLEMQFLCLLQRAPATMADRFFCHFDKELQWFAKHSLVKPGRETVIDNYMAWILKRQEMDKCWPLTPAWFFSLVAMNAQEYDLKHPVLQRALRRTSQENSQRHKHRPAGHFPDVGHGAHAAGMLNCGVEVREPPFARSVEYLLSKEVRMRGDWGLKVPFNVVRSVWYFCHENELYSEVDDTAVAMMVLARSPSHGYQNPNGKVGAALDRALSWAAAMECRDGIDMFDRDVSAFVTCILSCDFGEALDPTSVDVTPHAVEALSCLGQTMKDPLVKKAVRYLGAGQEDDGSWFGRWGVSHLYGVGDRAAGASNRREDMNTG